MEEIKKEKTGCAFSIIVAFVVLVIFIFLVSHARRLPGLFLYDKGSRMNIGISMTYPWIFDNHNPENENLKITHAQNLPKDSLLVSTDEFELTTENLPQPYVVGKYDEDFVFEDWGPGVYRGEGELVEKWDVGCELCGFENIVTGDTHDTEYLLADTETYPEGWALNLQIIKHSDIYYSKESGITLNPIDGSSIRNIFIREKYRYYDTLAPESVVKFPNSWGYYDVNAGCPYYGDVFDFLMPKTLDIRFENHKNRVRWALSIPDKKI